MILPYRHFPRRLQGFSLLELSIVLAIIALVTAMAVNSGIGIVSSSRQIATAQKMAIIDQALMKFRATYDRIPCPADTTQSPTSSTYGTEVTGTFPASLCSGANFTANKSLYSGMSSAVGIAVAEGSVPTATLNLPSDLMYDGWGNRIRYAVDASMTVAGAFTNTQIGALCGAITVYDMNFITGGSSASTPRSTGAIYILISHGPNGHGAYTRFGGSTPINNGSVNLAEQVNCHCNSSGTSQGYPYSPGTLPTAITTPSYVQADPSVDTANYLDNFDDIVSYKERWQMQSSWDNTGTVCPAIYVVDSGNNRVEKFDVNGNYLNNFNDSGGFSTPWGMASSSDGNLWVADSGNNRITEFDNTGAAVNNFSGNNYFGSAGAGTGHFSSPEGIAFDSSGNIWVVDHGNNRLQEFNSSGTYLLSIPSAGTSTGYANGLFDGPTTIAFSAEGNFWVTDYSNNRIEEFNASGAWLQTIPAACANTAIPACAASATAGKFSGPKGLSIDSSGNIWVVESTGARVQEFDKNGVYLGTFGASGTATGQFTTPYNTAFDVSRNIWVADYGNNRIQKLSPGGGTWIQSVPSSGVTSSATVGKFNAPTTVYFAR